MIESGYKNNVKNRPSIVNIGILLILTIVLLSVYPTMAQVNVTKTTPVQLKDSSVKKSDTNLTKSIRISKDSIDTPVKYTAADSGVMIMSSKEFYLYGNAKTEYKTSILEAATIVYDQQTQNIKAYGAKDTLGNPQSNPKFQESGMVSLNDSIYFNMKSGKGLTKNSNFQQGEIYINASAMKKINKDEAFAWKARFTT